MDLFCTRPKELKSSSNKQIQGSKPDIKASAIQGSEEFVFEYTKIDKKKVSYRKLYKKYFQLLQKNKSSIHPKSQINAIQINSRQKKESQFSHFQIVDNKYKVKKTRVWVNQAKDVYIRHIFQVIRFTSLHSTSTILIKYQNQSKALSLYFIPNPNQCLFEYKNQVRLIIPHLILACDVCDVELFLQYQLNVVPKGLHFYLSTWFFSTNFLHFSIKPSLFTPVCLTTQSPLRQNTNSGQALT